MTDRLERIERHLDDVLAGPRRLMRSLSRHTQTTGTDAMSTLHYDPAYPMIEGTDPGQRFGLTKREHFAAMMFQQFLAGSVLPPGFDASEQLSFAARRAIESADALIAELNKEAP